VLRFSPAFAFEILRMEEIFSSMLPAFVSLDGLTDKSPANAVDVSNRNIAMDSIIVRIVRFFFIMSAPRYMTLLYSSVSSLLVYLKLAVDFSVLRY